MRAFRSGPAALPIRIPEIICRSKAVSSSVFFRQHPGQIHRRFFLQILILPHGIAAVDNGGVRPPELTFNGRIDLDPVKAGQHFFQKSKVFGLWDIPVEEPAGVRGGVISLMKGPELRIGQ